MKYERYGVTSRRTERVGVVLRRTDVTTRCRRSHEEWGVDVEVSGRRGGVGVTL